MHFISEIRHNSETHLDERYYRIKESFRDLTGRVRSRILLNVGFLSPDPSPEDIRDVGRCLNWMQSNRGWKKEPDLFGGALSRYKESVRGMAVRFWDEMVRAGSLDAIDRTVEASRRKAERLIDPETMEHTDAREVGAEWICLQAIREREEPEAHGRHQVDGGRAGGGGRHVRQVLPAHQPRQARRDGNVGILPLDLWSLCLQRT